MLEKAYDGQTGNCPQDIRSCRQTGEEVQVFIGKPVQYDLNEWHCPYRIVGPFQRIVNFHIAAVDSIQALQLIWPVVDSAISGADLSLLWGGGVESLGLVSESSLKSACQSPLGFGFQPERGFIPNLKSKIQTGSP